MQREYINHGFLTHVERSLLERSTRKHATKNGNNFRAVSDKTEFFKLLGEQALSNFNWIHIITEIDGIIRSLRWE